MSDKETAPQVSHLLGKYLNTMVADLRIENEGQYLRALFSRYESELAGECRAPAPQPLISALNAYRNELRMGGSTSTTEVRRRLQDIAELAATPQVEPCDHFWRTIAINPKWSWFTECEKCTIGAPLKLQAENYVEGTTEQASPTPEKCPTCGSTSKNVYYAESNDTSKRCDPIVGRSDPWHSSATAPKSRDTGVSLDGGKTIHSKFKND